MGIKGLRAELLAVSTPFELSELRGQTVCVDGHGWLHRGAIGCAKSLAEGEKTQRYADFVLERVNMVKRQGVGCILVFDGLPLPAKSGTHEIRRAKRATALKAARIASEDGDEERAAKLYAQTVEVTEEMVRVTIGVVGDAARCCLVAPYEADPQLVSLCLSGVAQGVVSEDSDIFAYMALCHLKHTPLIMSLELTGNGRAIWGASPEVFAGAGKLRSSLCSLLELSGRMFLQACILSGCDYAQGAFGVGPVKAADTVLSLRSVRDDDQRLSRSARRLSNEIDYPDVVKNAEAAFYHALVWDKQTSSETAKESWSCRPLYELLDQGDSKLVVPKLDRRDLVGSRLLDFQVSNNHPRNQHQEQQRKAVKKVSAATSTSKRKTEDASVTRKKRPFAAFSALEGRESSNGILLRYFRPVASKSVLESACQLTSIDR